MLFEISETPFYVNIGCALNTLAHFQSPCQIIHIKWIIDEQNDHSPHTHSSPSLNLEALYFSAAYVPLRISYFGVAWGRQRTHRDTGLSFEVLSPVNWARNVQGLINPAVFSSSSMLEHMQARLNTIQKQFVIENSHPFNPNQRLVGNKGFPFSKGGMLPSQIKGVLSMFASVV